MAYAARCLVLSMLQLPFEEVNSSDMMYVLCSNACWGTATIEAIKAAASVKI